VLHLLPAPTHSWDLRWWTWRHCRLAFITIGYEASYRVLHNPKSRRKVTISQS